MKYFSRSKRAPWIGSVLVFYILFISKLFADPIDSYWQQKVDYDMDIVLHDSIRQISGKTTIKYTNNSPDSLDKIYMHLYPNAFQVGSVKYREYIGNSGRESRATYFKNRLEVLYFVRPSSLDYITCRIWHSRCCRT